MNLIDRHAEKNPDKAAIIWEQDALGSSEVISYRSVLLARLKPVAIIVMDPCRELLEMTCRVANVLKSDGVKKGDRVAIYMPVSPILVASMLACARIGAIHKYHFPQSCVLPVWSSVAVLICSVVFAGFSAESLKARIVDGELFSGISTITT